MRLITLLFVLLVCHLVALADDSKSFRGNPDHPGVYDTKPILTAPQIKWKFATKSQVVSSPAVVNDVVYVGSADHRLYAIDASTGAKKWDFKTGSGVASSPAVSGGIVYFSSYDGIVYAVSATDGKLKWKFETTGERRYAGTHLHGSQPHGEVMPDPFDTYLSSPLVWAGTLFIGSWDSYFYALDAATGKEKWRFKTGEDPDIHNQVGIQSSAVVAGGIVYFGCRDSNLYAIDAESGRKAWAYNNKGSWVIASPLVNDGKLYFETSDSGMFHAVDAKTGAEISSMKFSGWPTFSSPILAGDVFYLGSLSGKLFAIDLKEQKTLWEFQTDGNRQNGAAYTKADGTPNYELAYLGDFYDDMVVGVQKMRSVGAIYSSPVLVDGVLYLGSTDGNIYALQ